MNLVEKVAHAERIAQQQLRSMPTEAVLNDAELAAASEKDRLEIHTIVKARVQARATAS